jgi:4-diphosphocytidyl-2-C-methyl-D-erythritol kinase
MIDYHAGRSHNDCEPVVRGRYPQVAAALDWLGQFAPARLTGTGSCVFAAFATEAQARQVTGRVPAGTLAWAVPGLV